VPIANGLIDAFQGRDHADIATEFARVYPFSVISPRCRSDRGREGRHRLGVHDAALFLASAEESLAARAKLDAYVRPIIAARRRTRARISSHASSRPRSRGIA